METNSALRRLGTAHLVNSVGDGGFYVAGAVVFHELLGLSVAQIGLALTIAWTAGFAATTPIGRAADRWGPRAVAVTLSFVTAAATAGLLATSGVVSFTGVVVVYAVAQSGLHAARQTLVLALVEPGERTRYRARLQVRMNAGIGAGAVLGGLALLAASPAAYTGVLLLDAVGFVVAGLLLLRLPAAHSPVAAVPGARPGRGVWRDRPYVALAGVSAVLHLYMPVLSVVLPLFVVSRTAAPGWTVAAAFVINTAGVLVLQVRASRPVTSVHTAASSARVGGIWLAVSCLVFGSAALTDTPWIAAVAVLAGAVAQVVGEVRFAAGNWELGFALADPRSPGEWQGLFSAGVPVARAVGPLLLTVVVVGWDGPGWPALAGLLLAAAVTLPRIASRAARRHERPSPVGYRDRCDAV